MPLSQPETTIYTKMFKESPSLTGETMAMGHVVELCRDLGWTETDYPTPTIQSMSTKDGPLNCEDFLKMFETQPKKSVNGVHGGFFHPLGWHAVIPSRYNLKNGVTAQARKAKYTRDFNGMDKDNSGKICSTELAKYIREDDEEDVTIETSQARAKDILGFADSDNDNLLDLKEFLSIML